MTRFGKALLERLKNLSNAKGKNFEDQVAGHLADFSTRYPEKVTLKTKPMIELQNGEIVVPDFLLTVELPHERSHYFVECQDRSRYSKAILHKIQHVRAKQKWKTFLFVHKAPIPAELSYAIEAEGVMHLDMQNFVEFVRRLGFTLNSVEISEQRHLRTFAENYSKPDRAMLSG